jgi:hypothetical protein
VRLRLPPERDVTRRGHHVRSSRRRTAAAPPLDLITSCAETVLSVSKQILHDLTPADDDADSGTADDADAA